MNNMIEVFPATGAIKIAISDEHVSIGVEEYDKTDLVQIPRALFRTIVESILSGLDLHEIEDIAESAESYRQSAMRSGRY